MALSSDLIMQFVKATKRSDETKKETTVYGTIVESDSSQYVRLDGSELLTPISKTSDIRDGDRVTVLIKNHTALVTGNLSSPSARVADVTDITDEVAAAAKTATNYMYWDSSNGLQVGDRSSGSWSGFRTQITNAAFNILNAAGTVLASYGEKLIELGKNATDAVIKLCGGKGQIEYTTDENSGDDYLQVSADKLRLKSSEMSSLYSMYTDNSTRWEKSATNVTPAKVEMYSSECIDPGAPDNADSWNTSKVEITPDGIKLTTPGDIADEHGQFESSLLGTSDIWTYRKWRNGYVEMWGSYAVSDIACTTALGNMYRTAVFSPGSFPFTVYDPIVTASYESDGYGAFLWATTKSTTAALPSYYLLRPTSATIANGTINFHVFGKWKT